MQTASRQPRAAGNVTAWEHRIAGSAVMARFLGDKFNGVDDDAVDGAIARSIRPRRGW
jgi:hypothetical protein